MTFDLPWPPSVNGYWRSVGNRQIISAKGRAYRSTIANLLLAMGSPSITGELEAHITLHPPDRRRRDWDNWHKGVGDALEKGGFFSDDNQVRRALVEFGEVKRPGVYRLRLRRL